MFSKSTKDHFVRTLTDEFSGGYMSARIRVLDAIRTGCSSIGTTGVILLALACGSLAAWGQACPASTQAGPWSYCQDQGGCPPAGSSCLTVAKDCYKVRCFSCYAVDFTYGQECAMSTSDAEEDCCTGCP